MATYDVDRGLISKERLGAYGEDSAAAAVNSAILDQSLDYTLYAPGNAEVFEAKSTDRRYFLHYAALAPDGSVSTLLTELTVSDIAQVI